MMEGQPVGVSRLGGGGGSWQLPVTKPWLRCVLLEGCLIPVCVALTSAYRFGVKRTALAVCLHGDRRSLDFRLLSEV